MWVLTLLEMTGGREFLGEMADVSNALYEPFNLELLRYPELGRLCSFAIPRSVAIKAHLLVVSLYHQSLIQITFLVPYRPVAAVVPSASSPPQ